MSNNLGQYYEGVKFVHTMQLNLYSISILIARSITLLSTTPSINASFNHFNFLQDNSTQ